ncbi:MAG: DUF2842 domain-containing protein [Pseudomonadota bacterium]
MTPKIRKLIGTLIIVPFVTVYALAAMMLASALLPETSWQVQLLYYSVAGLAWVLPTGLIIKWMSKPEAAAN